jgi:Zn-dependent protease
VSQQLLASLIAAAAIILVAFPVHEFSHALAAYRLGDSTARYQGRLTLNPIVHFDPIGGVVLLVSTILAGFPVESFCWSARSWLASRSGGRNRHL